MMAKLPMQEAASDDDVFCGVPAIAKAFRLNVRQIYHWKEHHGFPTFNIGRNVCARRGAIKAWFREQEAASGGLR